MHTSVPAKAIISRSLDHLFRALLLALLALSSVHNVRGQGEAEHAYLLTMAGCDTDEREKAVWDALATSGFFVRVEVVRMDQRVKMLSNEVIDRATVDQLLSGTNTTITSMVDLMTGAHIGPDLDAWDSFLRPCTGGPVDQSDPAYTEAKRAWYEAHPNWRRDAVDTSSEVELENE
jgi:hypothetical protein